MSAPTSSAPHVLYIAWGFPPCRAGGVYRALATANSFAQQGAKVTVLTANRETFIKYTGSDLSLEALVDDNIEVIRVPFEWPLLETDIRKWPLMRILNPRLWRKYRIKLDTRKFPEVGYGPWGQPLTAAALDIHTSNPVDLVVASANPNVDFLPARELNKRFNIPFVMDYRDAWMLDVFDGGLLHSENSTVSKLEADYIEHATEIWFVNDPICAWHQKRYPEASSKMHVVANGFDPEFVPEPRLVIKENTDEVKFGYIGTLSPKVPLAEFVEGWRLACAEQPKIMKKATTSLYGYLGYYAAPNPVMAKIVASAKNLNFSYEGPAEKSKVSEIYNTFDALLLILGAGQYVTSGKVYEYMASALPIVSIHDPGNAASEVLRGYPLWFPISDLEPETISKALVRCAVAAKESSKETRKECWDFASKYERSLQLKPRIESLLQKSPSDNLNNTSFIGSVLK